MDCEEEFCYVCGKVLAEDDDHNDNWETNPLHCPSDLDEIATVDARWRVSPMVRDVNYRRVQEVCVERLSRIRTLTLLRAAVKKMGVPRFRQLRAKFESIQHCGFTEKEILNEDLTLIRRPAVKKAAAVGAK